MFSRPVHRRVHHEERRPGSQERLRKTEDVIGEYPGGDRSDDTKAYEQDFDVINIGVMFR